MNPNLPIGKRAELSDYKGSGYDRGHMAPAGDMTRSYKVMSESFYLSNMLPQTANLNRGLWKKLEEKTRELTRLKGDAFIICGPVFKDLNGDGKIDYLTRIGANRVWVPTHCYKIIVDAAKGKIDVASFIMPNQKLSGSLTSYLTTVDNIEKLTGLDFLDKLPDNIEKQVESKKTKNTSFWYTSVSRSYKSRKSTSSYKSKSFGGGIYHGNTSSKIFHKSTCRYYNCKSCTKNFNSRSDAINVGYRPCKICKP